MEYSIEESKLKEIMEYIRDRRRENSKCNQYQIGDKRREIINDVENKFNIPHECAVVLVDKLD